MELNQTPEGSSFSQGMYSDPPSVKRQPANKSGKGTHLTTIRDQGEVGPSLECRIEYTAKHNLPLGSIEVELGRVIEVTEVTLFPVYYDERSTVLPHPCVEVPVPTFAEQWWIDTANVILTEHAAIEERIVQEIVDKLAAG
jgi:hypothetical protein